MEEDLTQIVDSDGESATTCCSTEADQSRPPKDAEAPSDATAFADKCSTLQSQKVDPSDYVITTSDQVHTQIRVPATEVQFSR